MHPGSIRIEHTIASHSEHRHEHRELTIPWLHVRQPSEASGPSLQSLLDAHDIMTATGKSLFLNRGLEKALTPRPLSIYQVCRPLSSAAGTQHVVTARFEEAGTFYAFSHFPMYQLMLHCIRRQASTFIKTLARLATGMQQAVVRIPLKEGGSTKTPHTARTQFLELPSQKRANTPARGCNALYRPSRVPPRRSGTCRAAVAALAGTDQQTLRASYLE
ncbi:hypothetical protein EJ07DRAFT_155777 [Lizonia empirigonia]|nr:hypothetical protein EJ07DRAFT_155777 [Lizonia empirigonia]